MKKALLLSIMLVFVMYGYGQIPSYYNNVNLSLSGQNLKNELATKVTNTHTTFLSYTPGVWNALKQTDLDPTNSSKVILIYGYNDSDGNTTTDRTRGVNNNGGGSTDWNREHTYPRSLGNPNLGSSGPGSDAHHLRPSDVQRNSSRGNRKFADGSGVSGTTSQGYWYPGDEFKGDVARMMMYMYIRYGNRCLPTNVGIGSVVSNDANMIQLFLEWNAEDPVSALELQRNPLLEGIQGNRNPFIDNPAFATQIWGGPQAEDRFGTGGGDTSSPSIPFGLTATNTTTTTTQLSWSASTDNVAVTAYDIYRNGSLFTTTSGTTYAVNGLTPATSYSFAVRAKDAAGNVSSLSNTINVTTQSTTGGGNILCNTTITSFPYQESFENTFGDWKQAVAGDDFNWATRSGSTPSSGTGPESASNGSYYIYMESSSPNFASKRAILYSPCYDITVVSQALVSFNYHMYGSSAMGSLALEISLNGTSWTPIWNKTGNQGNSWETASIDLGSYIGEKIQLRFNGVTGTTWQGDMAIDGVNVTTSGNGGGNATIDVNLRITFDDYPEETSWEIRNDSNQVVYAGGTYGAQADRTTINISEVLDAGCYSLLMKDAYGDGICCNYGNGSYALTNTSDGSIVASGGSFGSQETKNFCISAAARSFSNVVTKLDADTIFQFGIYPNPTKEVLYLQLENAINYDYTISNHLGQILKMGKVSKEPIVLNQLTSGIYFVSILHEKAILVNKKFIKE